MTADLDLDPSLRVRLRARYHVESQALDVAVLVSAGERIRLALPGAPVLALLGHLQRDLPWIELQVAFTEEGLDGPQSRDLIERLRELDVLSVASAAGLAPEVLTRHRHTLAWLARAENPGRSRFDALRRLRAAHVLLVGVGALGSAVLRLLVAAGVGRVTGVDRGCIEEADLVRIATLAEVGSPRVDAPIVWCAASGCSYVPIREDIQSASRLVDLARTLAPTTMIYTAERPNWDINFWAAEVWRATGIPVLRANRFVVGPYKTDADAACPACIEPKLDRVAPGHAAGRAGARMARARRPDDDTGPTDLYHLAALAAEETVRALLDLPTRTHSAQIGFEGGVAIEKPFHREEACPVCADTGAQSRS